jgi:hypothetical protein
MKMRQPNRCKDVIKDLSMYKDTGLVIK